MLLAEQGEAAPRAKPGAARRAWGWGLARGPDLLWSPWLQRREELGSQRPRKTKHLGCRTVSLTANAAGGLPCLLTQSCQGQTQEARELRPGETHRESEGLGAGSARTPGPLSSGVCFAFRAERGPHSLTQAQPSVPCLRDTGPCWGARSQQSKNRLH